MSQRLFNQSFGVGTADLIADTDARTGKNYQVIQCIQETVIASITAPDLTDASDIVGLTLPAGLVIHTNVTAIDLTSGAVIGYTRAVGY